jgi:hypothetical protein
MKHNFIFWENFFKLDLFSLKKNLCIEFSQNCTILGYLATLGNNTICLFASHCELTNVVAAPVLEVLLCCFVSAVAACRFTCMCFAGDNTAPSIIIALCADSSSLFNTHSAPNFPAPNLKLTPPLRKSKLWRRSLDQLFLLSNSAAPPQPAPLPPPPPAASLQLLISCALLLQQTLWKFASATRVRASLFR